MVLTGGQRENRPEQVFSGKGPQLDRAIEELAAAASGIASVPGRAGINWGGLPLSLGKPAGAGLGEGYLHASRISFPSSMVRRKSYNSPFMPKYSIVIPLHNEQE